MIRATIGPSWVAGVASVHKCREGRALERFTVLGVRRLPVVGADGRAEGLFSIDSGLSEQMVFEALRRTEAPRE